MPGLLGYPAGSLGIIEPQMRLTEHMHAIIQLFGYSSPRDFFAKGRLVDRLKEIYSCAASIAFTSVEAYAAQCGTGEGISALKDASLMPVRKGQVEKLGAA